MSSSELSEPEVDIEAPGETSTKRRSGRVSRKPNIYTATPQSSKRKRDTEDDAHNDDAENDNADEDDEEEEEEDSPTESEGEPDEEEMREKAKARRKAKAPAAKKPAAKKTKTNGTAVTMPLRTATKGRRKKATAPNDEDAEQAGGLYGEFNGTHT